MSGTMRGIAYDTFGGVEVLQLREDLPVPPVGPDVVLVRVHAAGVNPVDVGIRSGGLAELFPHHFPIVPAAEGVGQVVDDNAQLGQGIAECQQTLDQARVRVGTVQAATAGGQLAQTVDKAGARLVEQQVAVPQVAVAQAEEQRLLRQGIEVGGEVGVQRVQIANEPEHTRVAA